MKVAANNPPQKPEAGGPRERSVWQSSAGDEDGQTAGQKAQWDTNEINGAAAARNRPARNVWLGTPRSYKDPYSPAFLKP